MPLRDNLTHISYHVPFDTYYQDVVVNVHLSNQSITNKQTFPTLLSSRSVNIRAAERLAVKEQLMREAQDQVIKATTHTLSYIPYHSYPIILLSPHICIPVLYVVYHAFKNFILTHFTKFTHDYRRLMNPLLHPPLCFVYPLLISFVYPDSRYIECRPC